MASHFRYLDAAGDANKVLTGVVFMLGHLTETRLGQGFGSKLRKSLVKIGNRYFCELISRHIPPHNKLTVFLGTFRLRQKYRCLADCVEVPSSARTVERDGKNTSRSVYSRTSQGEERTEYPGRQGQVDPSVRRYGHALEKGR